MMAGILAAWLQGQLRMAWALFGTVVMLIAYVVRVATRPSFLLTESGDFYLTESGDRFLLD